MATNIAIRHSSIWVRIRQLSQLDSFNQLSISANLVHGLSLWVDFVLAKQESTASMYIRSSYCWVIQATSWWSHCSASHFIVKSHTNLGLFNFSAVSTRWSTSIYMITRSMWSSLAYWDWFPGEVPPLTVSWWAACITFEPPAIYIHKWKWQGITCIILSEEESLECSATSNDLRMVESRRLSIPWKRRNCCRWYTRRDHQMCSAFTGDTPVPCCRIIPWLQTGSASNCWCSRPYTNNWSKIDQCIITGQTMA